MPKIFATSDITRDVKAVPLSVISVVGRYVCRVMMSMRTFAVLMADASVTGYAKRYMEKTSKAVMMFSYPPLVVDSVKGQFVRHLPGLDPIQANLVIRVLLMH